MKALSWIIAVVLAVLAIIFGIMWINAANKADAAEKKASDAQKLYETVSTTLSEVQTSLEALDEDLLGSIAETGEIPGSTPEDRRNRLISNISNMRTQIEADKKKIAELERQVSQTRGQRDGYLSTLNSLKASMAEKERILAELEGRLTQLNEDLSNEKQQAQVEISKRDSQIKERDNIIQSQSEDLNQIYYIYGTRKELIAAGVIDRKGGILGLGRVTTVTSKLITEKFSTMNLMDSDEIVLPESPKGYSVLSNHVAASYTLDKEGSGWILKVTDPESFRKQKFLVLEKK